MEKKTLEAEEKYDGMLQLFDEEPEKPKDITERVKTLYNAQKVLEERAEKGETTAHRLLEEYNQLVTSGTTTDLKDYLQLRIIAAAINEGWEPQFTEDEERWYPYIVLWTQEEIDKMGEAEKDYRELLLWGGPAYDGTRCGSSSSHSYNAWATAAASLGSRLAYKTQALASYAGRQFAGVYARFYIGERAKDAKPWREFEAEQAEKTDKE